VPDGDRRFVPTEHARGPWDPRALHGGAPAALIAAAFERLEPGTELPIARLSFEFLRPIPMAPLTLTTTITRPGRRVQALAAEMWAGDTLVCRASALRVMAVPEELPEFAAQQVAERARPVLPEPHEGYDVRFALDDNDEPSFAVSGMEMRWLDGEPGHGPATVWMRLRQPLLPGEPSSPLARVVGAADFGNGVSAVLPFGEWLFINADLTISLDRRPQGEWIALQARTLLYPGGVGWTESALHDERGPLGLATQALVVQPR